MKALVLAGGFPQIALLEELRSRGIKTILADYGDAPVAKPYADVFYRVSTLDVGAITEVAQRERVDFLITVCTDQALLTVADVSKRLGLYSYVDYQTALNVTNKAYMKEKFTEHGIPTAPFVVLKQFEKGAIFGLKYPLIVKPVDCNSSKGVRKATNDEELLIAFEKARLISRTNTAIIEEYVSGQELSIDAYVENGTAHLLCVTNSEKIAAEDKFVIFRTIYPAAVPDTYQEEIRGVVQRIAEAFGLTNTPMLVQMIFDGRGFYVLEFSARTGGGGKHQLIKRVSGVDIIKATVDLTLRIKPEIKICPSESKYLIDEFIYCFPGEFDKLVGFLELKDREILTDYFLFKGRGAKFDKAETSGDRLAGFTIQADTLEELKRKHREVCATIQVCDSNGRDILRHDLLADVT